jgi:hypothetical protein
MGYRDLNIGQGIPERDPYYHEGYLEQDIARELSRFRDPVPRIPPVPDFYDDISSFSREQYPESHVRSQDLDFERERNLEYRCRERERERGWEQERDYREGSDRDEHRDYGNYREKKSHDRERDYDWDGDRRDHDRRDRDRDRDWERPRTSREDRSKDEVLRLLFSLYLYLSNNALAECFFQISSFKFNYYPITLIYK